MAVNAANKKKAPRRVKREDVAVAAGVSSATVSYVLNKTKHLSPEVEQRVLEAAKHLNYRPDRIAQSLAGGRTNTLAVITSDISNTYQLEVIKGLQAEALKNDFVVFIFDAQGDAQKYVNHLITRRVDGVFASVMPDFLSDELLCELRDAHIAVISDFSRGTYLPDVSYIMSDMYDGFLQAVGYLKEIGHVNIGYLSAFDESCYYDQRLNAYKTAMRKQFGNNTLYIEYGSWPYTTSKKLGEELMGRMLAEHSNVTAVIATNDLMAIGAVKAVRRAGLRVPEDISVIGIDNIDQSEQNDPPLTTLDQNGREYGAKIFHILYENITEHITGKFIIPMKLIKRGSVAECRKSE